jgi:hypothetical protein
MRTTKPAAVFLSAAIAFVFAAMAEHPARGESRTPSAQALSSASFDGKWSGATKCIYDPGLWPDDVCGATWVIEIGAGKVKVQQIIHGKDGKETKTNIDGRNFQFRQLETNAVISSLDSGNDEDGHWVETWDFAMTLKDPDHMMVHWTRIVNNVDLALDKKGSKFSIVEMGELTRSSQPVALKSESTGTGEAATFDYPTVAAALAALKARSDVSISGNGGWTIVDDKTNHAVWSFTPSNYPAYPAVVKRVLVQDAGGNVSLRMTGLCQADKASCDKLMEDFRAMNERVRQGVQSKH